MNWTPDICIYHGGCDDGFGAAWAVWKRWPDCKFIPGVYGKAPPDVAGKNVLMVDFSYKYDEIAEMSWKAKRIVILDHHKTAESDLARLPAMEGLDAANMEATAVLCWSQNMPEIMAYFDMNQSGAVLAWEFCHGIPHNDPPPTMLAYIQDRDLWRFAFGDKTREFSAALRTYPMDFAVWDQIAADPDRLLAEGKIVLRAHQVNIRKFMDDTFTERISGYEVPCCNVPYHYASDTAHELLQRFPDAPFALCWFKRGDGLFQASLRSEDHRVDVSEIAKKYGGGGHRNAAGFQVPSMKDTTR